jgi:chromosome segregation ATPase
MKTVEELEAELETVTRERDRSLFAWESAGMTGRTAQSAMLELARQLEEARAEIAILTTALDERDVEAERSLEQYDSLMHQLADATNESTHFQVMCKRETEEVERLTSELQRERIGIRPVDEVRSDAYRRGAEVMRDACAARLIAFGSDRLGHAITREHAAEIVGGTPIPEEP